MGEMLFLSKSHSYTRFPSFFQCYFAGFNHYKDKESSYLRQEQESKKKMKKYKVCIYYLLKLQKGLGYSASKEVLSLIVDFAFNLSSHLRNSFASYPLNFGVAVIVIHSEATPKHSTWFLCCALL